MGHLAARTSLLVMSCSKPGGHASGSPRGPSSSPGLRPSGTGPEVPFLHPIHDGCTRFLVLTLECGPCCL